MREPSFTKATDGNCGMYAIYMALNAYGFDINAEKISEVAIENKLSINGELYRTGHFIKLIQILKDNYNIECCLEVIEFRTIQELKNIITEKTKHSYVLLPYYAFQGLPITSVKPNMKRGHWCIIYDINGDSVFGKQSNSKADSLNVLKDVSITKMFNSNKMLDNIKVNMGKYNKCAINIPKKQLAYTARCGLDKCKFNKDDTSNCIFNSDIAYKAFVLRKTN